VVGATEAAATLLNFGTGSATRATAQTAQEMAAAKGTYSLPAAFAAEEYQSFINASSRASQASGINFFKDRLLRIEMNSSVAGKRVLAAADAGEIDLVFSTSASSGLYGRAYGNQATVYLEQTQNGHTYALVGVHASGYQFSAAVGIHEGLHALGVGGSRRAEALARLAELDNLGVSIDRLAMRQVLTDMGSRKNGPYSHLPWRSGDSSPHFPGLQF
jgi:hypothetical protein